MNKEKNEERRRKYNRICLAATIIGVVLVILWGVFSALSAPDKNALGVYGEKGTEIEIKVED